MSLASCPTLRMILEAPFSPNHLSMPKLERNLPLHPPLAKIFFILTFQSYMPRTLSTPTDRKSVV